MDLRDYLANAWRHLKSATPDDDSERAQRLRGSEAGIPIGWHSSPESLVGGLASRIMLRGAELKLAIVETPEISEAYKKLRPGDKWDVSYDCNFFVLHLAERILVSQLALVKAAPPMFVELQRGLGRAVVERCIDDTYRFNATNESKRYGLVDELTAGLIEQSRIYWACKEPASLSAKSCAGACAQSLIARIGLDSRQLLPLIIVLSEVAVYALQKLETREFAQAYIQLQESK